MWLFITIIKLSLKYVICIGDYITYSETLCYSDSEGGHDGRSEYGGEERSMSMPVRPVVVLSADNLYRYARIGNYATFNSGGNNNYNPSNPGRRSEVK